MTAQLFVFPIRPMGQRAVQLTHIGIQRRAIVPPVKLQPAPDLWIEHPRQIFDGLVTASMQIPASNLLADRFPRFVGNGRAEVDEVLAEPILRSPGLKTIAQKIELLVRVSPPPVVIQ